MEKIKSTIKPLGDAGILLSFGNSINPTIHQSVQHFFRGLKSRPFTWMVEAVPAFSTIALYYDPLKIKSYHHLIEDIGNYAEKLDVWDTESQPQRIIEIPVCYGGEFGPDLKEVAKHNDVTPEEVISLHSKAEYLVYMIGFTPGFPYLGGMPERLATPRRKTPRLKIPAGSVGIAGGQTGVYPMSSPGGWQIIGRTPLVLFQVEREQPSVLKAGDLVQFYPISPKEFSEWEPEEYGD